jgi:uncharacterized membrane-anchored protein
MMQVLRLIFQIMVSLLKQVWQLPHTLANALRQRQRQFALNALEAERLDRIRNPSKYLGKES